MPPPPLCRHCSARPGYQARALCGPCYRDRSVRDRYPMPARAERPRPPEGREAVAVAQAQDQADDDTADAAPPVVSPQQLDEARRPCVALPGTDAKLEAMARRAELRLPLFIEGDVRRRL